VNIDMVKGSFSKKNPVRVGLRCMVFPDKKSDNLNEGSRYFYGIIRDVFQGIITVEVVDSTWSEFKKADQLWFKPYQIFAEHSEVKQLALFE
jgi:hypothetical protein